MKQIYFKLILFLGLMIPMASISAEEVTVGKAKYDAENGMATLVDFKKAQGVVEIPNTITDKKGASYTVSAIGKGAFKGCKATEIRIPETVSTLGDEVFKNSKQLVKVTLPKSVTIIPQSAFESCKNLTDVEMPGAKRLEDYAFLKCGGLNTLNLPEGLEYIGVFGLRSTGLKSLIIPGSVMEIDKSALGFNNHLETLEFLPSDKTIKLHDFLYGTPLKRLVIDRNYEYIPYEFDHENRPFNHNPALNEIVIGEKMSSLPSNFIEGCNNLNKVEIKTWMVNENLLSYISGNNISIIDPDGNESSISKIKSTISTRKNELLRQEYISKLAAMTDLAKVYEEYSLQGQLMNKNKFLMTMDRAVELSEIFLKKYLKFA